MVAAVATAEAVAAVVTPERWKYPMSAVSTKLIGTEYAEGIEPEMALKPLKTNRMIAVHIVFDFKSE